MDMSVNTDPDGPIDYSDFEYQQVNLQHRHDSLTGGDATSQLLSEYEPLGGIGGLDNNEVAELTFLELQVNIDHDQVDSDQDVGSETRFVGVFGANLPPSNDLLPFFGTDPDSTVVNSGNVTASSTGSTNTEDRVFAPYQFQKSPAFDDQANGPGGASSPSTLVVSRPWRSMVGRGPVLDSTDNIGFLSQLTQDDEIIEAVGEITAHCVWDVAETSDAGRAFSVPMD